MPEKMLHKSEVILPYIFLTVIVVINSDRFADSCGQVLANPGTTAGGTKASIAPWTVSIGSQVICEALLLGHFSLEFKFMLYFTEMND